MTLADPPTPGYGIFHKYFFFEPFPNGPKQNFVFLLTTEPTVIYLD